MGDGSRDGGGYQQIKHFGEKGIKTVTLKGL